MTAKNKTKKDGNRFYLGVDIGSTSIGWSLVFPQQKNIVCGVTVFPYARVSKTSSESLCQKRREVRLIRRQNKRTRSRKKLLYRKLISNNLWPVTESEENAILSDINYDPYFLRHHGLIRKLSLYELGRILIHLNQRRGFKSNLKTGNPKENGLVLSSISELQQDIAKSNCSTLGEFLYSESTKGGTIRRRYTKRSMYIDEFNLLMSYQKQFYPDTLNDSFVNELFRIIFFQRNLLPSKHLIGKCSLEPDKRRCPKADLHFQLFRILQNINTLKIKVMNGEERKLSHVERKYLLELLLSRASVKFNVVRKKLKLSGDFNLEFEGQDKLLGSSSYSKFLAIFGKAWDAFDFEKKANIIRRFLNIQTQEGLERFAGEFELDKSQRERLASTQLEKGYANYSLKAILKLLPFMRKGALLSGYNGEQRSAIASAGYLRPDQVKIDEVDFLPSPPKSSNPVVSKSLHTLRKIVNAIIKEYGKPECITVELARDLDKSADEIKKIINENKRNEDAGLEAKKLLEKHNINVTRNNVNKVILWEQQKRVCIYSGKSISLEDLFLNTECDHIIPWSLSLNDSLNNRIVCFTDENQRKGQRSVCEWLGGTAKFEDVLNRSKVLPTMKRRMLLKRSDDLKEIISRHLNDTRYASRLAVSYLSQLGCKVRTTRGSNTAKLRGTLGIKKNRGDHRHHAIDASLCAITTSTVLRKIASRKEDGILPWDGFSKDLLSAVNKVSVRHLVNRSTNQQLHEDTFYSKISENEYSKRKRLENINLSEVEKILHPLIRKHVKERLDIFGIQTASQLKSKVNSVWASPLIVNGMVVKNIRVRVPDSSIVPIRGGTIHVKPGGNHHVAIFCVQENGKTTWRAIYVTLLEAADRIRRKLPVVDRKYPGVPDAKFIMSLCPGDAVLSRIDGKSCLMVVSTLVSTQRRIHLVDSNDANPSAKKKNIGCTIKSFMEKYQSKKVTVDSIGRIRWAND